MVQPYNPVAGNCRLPSLQLCFGFILVYAKHPGFCEDPVSKRDILNCSCNRCIYGKRLTDDLINLLQKQQQQQQQQRF